MVVHEVDSARVCRSISQHIELIIYPGNTLRFIQKIGEKVDMHRGIGVPRDANDELGGHIPSRKPPDDFPNWRIWIDEKLLTKSHVLPMIRPDVKILEVYLTLKIDHAKHSRGKSPQHRPESDVWTYRMPMVLALGRVML